MSSNSLEMEFITRIRYIVFLKLLFHPKRAFIFGIMHTRVYAGILYVFRLAALSIVVSWVWLEGWAA